jgi:hypothetical protein
VTDETWYVLLRSGLFEWLRDTHSFDVLDPRCAKCGASWREFMVEPFACDSRLADDVQGQADDVLLPDSSRRTSSPGVRGRRRGRGWALRVPAFYRCTYLHAALSMT